jgi:uncharacterized protein
MQVDSLWRYPIKGMSPERLAFADLTEGYGFAFDRAYAVTDGSFEFDPVNPQPMPKTHFLMLAKYERLALLTTCFDVDTRDMTVEGPAGARRYSLGVARDQDALAAYLTEFLGAPLRGQAKVAHADGHQFTDVSVHSTAMMRSISLINLATVHDLGQHVGTALDPLRFRANVYFDGAEAWSELDWVGRDLKCGDVRLRVVKRTQRCPATSVNPGNGVRDLNVPAAIRGYRNHADCGIYAEVIGAGRMQPGAEIKVVHAD